MTDVPRVELAPDYSISKIINGCWQLTSDHGGGPGSKKDTLHRFAELVDHGFTTFDCADIYTGTEELLGEFRRKLSDSDAIQIHTKLVPNKDTLADLDDKKIASAIDESLRKLHAERLDLVQFHWWDYDITGLERLYDRLLYAQSIGKIRLLGVTNFNTEKLKEIVNQDASLVSMQAQYSLLDRRPERNMTKYCAEKNISLLPYGVLAGGFLTDKYRACPAGNVGNRSLQKYRLMIDEAGGWDVFQRLVGVLAGIADKHQSGVDAIAASWVLKQPTVAAIILGIGSRSRIKENLALANVELDDEDQNRIAECLELQAVPNGEPYDLERDSDGIHGRIIRSNLLKSGST